MTRTVVSQMCQWLQSLDITTLSLQLQQHLLLLETAAKGSLIKEHVREEGIMYIIYCV